MQPKFTQRSLAFVCTKLLAMALVLVLSAQASFSQQTKPLSKEQQLNQAKQKLGATSDVVKPVASQANSAITARVKPVSNGTIQPDAVCATFTGSLQAGDQTMALRLNRGGAGTGSTCAASVFPGNAGAGPYFFDTYTWVNPQATAQCITLNLKTTDVTDANIQVAGYLGTFNPANLATNYLGDPGVSTGIPAAAAGIDAVFNVPGLATVVIVVFHTNPSAVAANYTVTVNAICTPCVPTAAGVPTISSVPSTTCAGSPITLSILAGNLNGAANWQWYSTSCGGTPVGSGTSITVSPVATTTYFARGEGGCAPAPGACGQQTVTVTPCTCLSPDAATICSGTIQRIRINGTGAPGSSNVPSGAITVAIPDNAPAGASHTLPVTLPAGATLTGVSVNFNITHTFDGDLQINLKAPNNAVLNLVNLRGGGGDNFTNTTIATGGASLATGAAPFTGTFAPDGAIGVGPTAFTSTVNSFAGLLSVGEGNWTIALRDNAGLDVGTLTGWTITFNYTLDPTGLWTGGAGTIFTDPNAGTAYVPGTQRNVVWVKPTTTTTYTATLAAGPCAGANNVTITVLPTPVVSVTPNNACSPATLTATGGSIYNWSPATGLNTTTGATVIATTATDATYTVNSYGANGCPAAPVSVSVKGSSIAAVISLLGAPPTVVWTEGFEAAALPANWAQQNNSTTIGTVPNWIFGDPLLAPAQNGSPNSYVLGNFNLVGSGNISNWLFTPVTTLNNGDQVVFWTRTVAAPAFPDRLQVRMSSNGASVNVGATDASVGDFSTLLLDINPGLTTTGYPASWTQFTATITGLAGPTSGRIAFRYFVADAGPTGNNSDNIGIDNVTYQKPALGTCANSVSRIKIDITGGSGPYEVVYTNGTTNYTVPGYISGTPIDVFSATTTTFTIVSVRSANGCTGSGNTGSAVLTITPAPSITTQPANRTVCDGGSTTFVVAAGPALGTTYQWQVSTDGGATYTNLANGGNYSTVTGSTLNVTGITTGMSGNRYRVVINGLCPPNTVTSAAATLTVNVPPTITTQPVNRTSCVGTTGTFSVVATGNAPTYQWQVSTNSGLTFTNIAGATGATLSLANVSQQMNNNQYRVVVTVAPCATTVTSAARTLSVNALPTVTLSASNAQLTPGGNSTLTVTSNPGAQTPASYSYTLNGVTVAGATGSTLPVNINGLGTYRAQVTDINGCVGTSNTVAINAESSDRLWLYPNPTDGQFQARWYYGSDVAERREVSVYNAQGQQVARASYDLVRGLSPYMPMNFDLSHVAPGTYVVKVTEKNSKRIITGVIVIQ